MAEASDRGTSAGEQVRREVLGGGYVDRAAQGADAFTVELQDHLNQHCWGATWVRPGLDLRTRSLVTLCALAAQGHWHEFATHVEGALRLGWSPEELREILLHLGVYLGVPTAVQAFRAAQPIVASANQRPATDPPR